MKGLSYSNTKGFSSVRHTVPVFVLVQVLQYLSEMPSDPLGSITDAELQMVMEVAAARYEPQPHKVPFPNLAPTFRNIESQLRSCPRDI